MRTAVVLGLFLAMALSAVVVTAPAARADHDTVPWSSFFTIADQTGSSIDNGYPTVVPTGNGYFYVFYLKRDPGANVNSLWVEKWRDRGALGVPELIPGTLVRVNPTGTQPADSTIIGFGLPTPSGAIDASGNLYVAWATRANQIYVSKSTDGGLTWPVNAQASPVPVAGTVLFDLPSLTVLTNGTVYVAFEQIFVTGPTFFGNVTTAFSTDSTTYRGYTNASGQAHPFESLFANVDLVSDAHGRLYLAYSHIASFSAFYANRTWSDNGLSWAAPTPLNGGAGQAYLPSLAVDPEGHVHAAWVDGREAPDGLPTIWYAQSTDRGATWSIPLPVSAGLNYPFFPTVTSLGSNVMVAWAGSGRLGYAVSADGGKTFYPEAQSFPSAEVDGGVTAMDENGTVYAAFTDTSGTYAFTGFVFWDGPPSPPSNAAVATSGSTGLTVSWAAPPEKDVVEYRVWRSADGGASYQLVATVGASTLSYTDTGLVNGTYWYKVTAVDDRGTSSHDSTPRSGVVGPTTAELIANLQSEIASLQNQLAQVNASTSAQLAALQVQIIALQGQLTTLQNSQATSNAATAAELALLQQELTNLRTQLNQTKTDLANAQAQQATQTMSYVNTGLAVVIIALLAAILLVQLRKPKGPQLMMAQPGQASPKKPDDEL